jgi:hypothetical protein
MQKLHHDESLVLNSWLRHADQFYIDGRLLWFNQGINGACVLLWLSLEQMLKTLIFQKRLRAGLIMRTDNIDILNTLNKAGRSFNHELSDLIIAFKNDYPRVLSVKDIGVLTKLHEFFSRRYVSNTNSLIRLDLITSVDNLYFKLREYISASISLSIIDEIGLRLKIGIQHPLEGYMIYAYIENQYFRRRKKYPIYRVQFNQNLLVIDSGRITPIRYEEEMPLYLK